MSTAVKKVPTRQEVPQGDRWNLVSLCDSDTAWREQFDAWQTRIDEYQPFQGTLGQGPDRVRELLEFDLDFSRQAERLGAYAFLRMSENVADGAAQEMVARYQNAASRAGQAASFIRPELMALPDEQTQGYLEAESLRPYRLMLERIFRDKPHTLSQAEERLLAMQTEMAGTPQKAFSQLNDSDLSFGEMENAEGQTIELSHSTFREMLETPAREVRQHAFHQYYAQYDQYKNTIAATLAGSIHSDIYYARVRNFASAREASLFQDNVPVSVYDNLLGTVEKYLPSVHRYYQVRKRAMKLDEIHYYDTYVPILADLRKRHSWDEAVDLITTALEPLGSDYCAAMEEGLKGRWCDRYENKGKRSGAFSAGTYDGDPFILMNYQPDVLDHVFTLAHEAGHSMHSYYSSKSQPFQYYDYVIFVAEVASTFNEQLLGRYLQDRAADDRERAYLINKEIDDIRQTLVRQTMFAEFEKITHELAENHEPLTVDRFRGIYRDLLVKYLGPEFAVDEKLELECFRIPHFYRAFYVYKYATGLSASIALSERVLSGGEQELSDYLNFLRGGCSKWPLDLLRDAGVDLEQPTPIETALQRFDTLVDELDRLLSSGVAG